MPKVFLAGTKNSNWREKLIPTLRISHFNPYSSEESPEFQARVDHEFANCDYILFVITPGMDGYKDILSLQAETQVRPKKIIFCHIGEEVYNKGHIVRTFTQEQIASLSELGRTVKRNGGVYLGDIASVSQLLNSKA